MTKYEVFVFTKSGQAPTKKFAAKLMNQIVSEPSNAEAEMLAGYYYMYPKVMAEEIRKRLEKDTGKILVLAFIKEIPFPPTAYKLYALGTKEELKEIVRRLLSAEDGKTTFEIGLAYAEERRC